MLKQLAENMPETKRRRMLVEIAECANAEGTRSVLKNYGIELDNTGAEVLSALEIEVGFSQEELEFIAGGKTNFLMNVQNVYKNKL